MERKIIKTADGSVTIHLPEWDEHYHSKHGAIQEAKHVFIDTGLDWYLQNHDLKEISILEIGFGTGLNAFITALEAEKRNLKISYSGVEAYPVSMKEAQEMNYAEELSAQDQLPVFLKMHEVAWGEEAVITSHLKLTKRQIKFEEIKDSEKHHLVYFDAFGARVQPSLWTEEIFKIMYDALLPTGTLVTYSAKGSARRAMQAVGFEVSRLPGPPGKREMLRAVKL